jgi:hypothetical protein
MLPPGSSRSERHLIPSLGVTQSKSLTELVLAGAEKGRGFRIAAEALGSHVERRGYSSRPRRSGLS